MAPAFDALKLSIRSSSTIKFSLARLYSKPMRTDADDRILKISLGTHSSEGQYTWETYDGLREHSVRGLQDPVLDTCN